ncbi:Asp-tRNA(Asn)/Glu-tRNA(Gln) amidotransferase subunit GatA [Candidatus Dojkabacteria bacterium]|uniref:Glutamyl-tRNA(Gln) amidotransferase subunit A n=1 Tax=Candidatus Dojkabacteria bacterium TaxID=2099670 RepID=A0A955L697_9BACT|nr:Asp-tRNA(Asn)/Glu-tRNA(Gln) amidotransferase subunit GatA [Candidatus Dojkabacteria bacterium]
METKGLTIAKAKEAFSKGEYTSQELLNAHINKISELDNKLHAFVDTTFEQAAESLEVTGKPLSGIPASIKDNFNWKGTKTTASSNILKNYISPYNATVTERLIENGGCLVGKTNMDAFAHGSSTETSDFFTTLNPYNEEHVAGGSSGGSAVAVATGMSVYAIGSETAGSVRGPASWCGVYGFTPTYGRISRYGVIAMGSSLDRPGVFTNNVEDAALLLDLLSGKDERDATSIQEPAMDTASNLDATLTGKRIGIPKQYFDDRINKEVIAAIEEAIAVYKKAGAEIIELDLLDPKYSIAVYTVVQRSEVSSNLARIDGIRYGHYSDIEAETILDQISYNRGEGFGNEAKQRSMTGAYTLSAGYYDAYYKKAQQVRTLIIEDFAKAFTKVDLILGPTMPETAPKLGVTKNNPLFGELADVLTEPSALAGLPCISIPVGYDSKGLPIGMQLIGNQFAEQDVLNAAYGYQQLTI